MSHLLGDRVVSLEGYLEAIRDLNEVVVGTFS